MASLVRSETRLRWRGGRVAALLGLALVVLAAITWEAARAARAERATAEAVLRDYAAFAAWEFARVVEQRLERDTSASISRLMPLENQRSLQQTPHVHAGAACGCGPELESVRTFVHWGSVSDEWRVAGQPLPEAARVRLTDAVTSAGHGESRRTVRLTLMNIDGALAVLAWRLDGESRAIVHALLAEPAFLHTTLARASRDEPLLPPTLTARAGDRPVLSLRAHDASGRELFATDVEGSEYSADAVVADELGGIRIVASLAPDAAAALVIGGLPSSRLPWLYGLIALAGVLVATAIVQMRRQAELIRLRGDFVSGVSHELRTPLAQIRMFAETLWLGRVRSADESARSLQIIHREAQRLSHLVDNVLSFSRLDRGLSHLSTARITVPALLGELAEAVQPFVTARHSRLAVEAPPDLTCVADGAALRQMLINLVDNALKYGPEHQTITIVAERDAGVVRVAVTDQGPGIADAIAERVWEPFWRAGGSSQGGSGIGLAIVRDLAVAHGGRAYLERGVAAGARFVIELPDPA